MANVFDYEERERQEAIATCMDTDRKAFKVLEDEANTKRSLGWRIVVAPLKGTIKLCIKTDGFLMSQLGY